MNLEAPITPDIIRDHGLSAEEYQRLCESLGRTPNIVELGIVSVMWSEHCSYKSSRIHLRELPTSGPRVLQGPGENAGVVDIGDGLAVCFKMESHNHPSFIEPYQGAATGVGGILRDIFTMGARPFACLNSLRFGNPQHPKTKHLVRGVVAGIGGYGNPMGIPTVGGEVAFDDCYNGNILVNAFTIGLLRADRIFRGAAAGKGNPVIYIGSKTGRDGIHGATMASDAFDATIEERRPTVQVGDPFTEKKLLEACLELMAGDCLVGIQDMGAAGLTCSSFEMADRAGMGMVLDLDRVPRREEGMTPYDVMLSESQERMLLVVQSGREAEVRTICDKWDIDMAVVGYVTDDGRVRVLDKGETVVDMPVAPIAGDAPLYNRPASPSPELTQLHQFDPQALPLPRDLNDVLMKLMSSPNLACKSWVWEQYDHMVMTNTVVRPGADAAILRVKGTKKGIALTSDCNSRFCFLDPYLGAMLAVAEAARNISACGGEPLAVTDCLNFGNPERPEVMWQFQQAVAGMAEACRQFHTPIVSGNVSFYNETDGVGIYPTPTIAMVGLVPDLDRIATPWWKDAGDVILLLGRNELELGGSEYLKQIHGQVKGTLPHLNMERELAVQRACRIGITRGVVKSAHDCSEGGLAVTLAECSLMRRQGLLGATVELSDDLRPDALFFGEAASRIVLSVAPASVDLMVTIAKEEGAPVAVIGKVGGRSLVMNNGIQVDLADLHDAWTTALPKLFS
ncbi:MAG: phosphoribosylformylglycinamidine synthase subunit PurL [Deltaproteobacteria bacterium]|nr:phosphoribosylformylglycinamidine synthase subunit PurL [Deltaproteobacteria bacterium]